MYNNQSFSIFAIQQTNLEYMKEVVIVSAVRTPMGSFMGGFSGVHAPQLGATAIKGALDRIGLKPEEIEEVFMGNVLQAGLGQSPARQAALAAGLSVHVPSTTINKVCSSGMKSLIIAAQSIQSGDIEVAVAGGMENMSAVPSYLMTNRTGQKLGDQKLIDGLLKDGLINVYDGQHMGNCAETCATDHSISREEQDAFAIQSYERSAKAWEAGKFKNEIIPVSVPQRRGDDVVISEDEEYKNVKMDKIPTLRPVFDKEGTVTAANASTLNDGASALILMSKEKASSLGLQPLAKVIAYADAAIEPEKFTTAPAVAVEKALKKAQLSKDNIDFWELNEAFSVVGLANMKILGLNPEKVNIYGGAVSLGHPLGNSGSRIMVTLLNILDQEKGKLGCAAICNGGGGASAMIIEKL